MEMSRRQVLKLFREFLIKHDSLDFFVKSNKEQSCCKVNQYSDFIISSFNLREDTIHWSKLNKLWIEELKQKGIEC